MGNYRLDKTGNRYGFLVVIGHGAGITANGRTRFTFQCRCDCGNVIEVRTDDLSPNKGQGTKSCGCKGRMTAALKRKKVNRRRSGGMGYDPAGPVEELGDFGGQW